MRTHGFDSFALAKEERSSASEGDPVGARLRLGAAVHPSSSELLFSYTISYPIKLLPHIGMRTHGFDSFALAKEERSSASEGDPVGARLRLGAAVHPSTSELKLPNWHSKNLRRVSHVH
ncbi:MAG: hypothetical protein H7A39_05720 [Chlamydiales bacterium]|nr:hypothetical protein [Chlamydiales bacterium]